MWLKLSLLCFALTDPFGSFLSARAVSEAKEAALANQDYARCKQIKPVEKELHGSAMQYHKLFQAKEGAVRSEDYDRADILKAEMASLQERAANILNGLGIVLPPLKSQKPPSPSQDDEPETAIEDPGLVSAPAPADFRDEDVSLQTLLEEVEADTMMAQDEKVEPNQPPSPRLESLLETVNVQSPRQKIRGDVEVGEGETINVAADVTAGGTADAGADNSADTGAHVNAETDVNAEAEADAEADVRASDLPPDDNLTPALDISEAVLAKEYIDNQNSEAIDPRVAELPREPTPPPELWEEEEVPRGSSPPRTPTPPPLIVPDGQEIQNEIEEVRLRLQTRETQHRRQH